MITLMREYARGLKLVLLLVILAFIATSVVYFGTSAISDGVASGTAVASVNGEPVPVERYRRVYGSYMEMYRQVYRERFTPELAERLGLAQQVVNDLVTDALIVQQARREGLRASDEEVQLSIFAIPAFQQDGRFSSERYQAVLRQIRVDPATFEEEQRRALERRKMESLIRDGVKVTEAEVREAWTAQHERVRAAWAGLEMRALLAQVKVDEAGAEAYLKTHAARFTRPERRRIEYVVVAGRHFAEPVSDADAERYYREHPKEFERPRRVKVAHVLARVPGVGGSQAEERARAKVEDVIRRARAGEDFAKLAREVSEDSATARQGGELGLIGPGEMVKPFEDAAFALKKGEITAAPVRTGFGWHAIKALDIQEGGREPFKEAAARIKERLLAERSEAAAEKKAAEVRPALVGARDFAAEARRLRLELRDGTVARGDGLPDIGRDQALEDTIFGLAPGGTSTVVKTAGGLVIVRALEVLPAGVPPLAQIRDEVLAAMRREEAEKQGASRANALAEALARGGDFMDAARKDGFTTGETPVFSRAEPPKGPAAALPGAVLLAALQTPVGQVSRPVTTTTGVYLVKTLERQPPDPAGFEAERRELERRVLETKRMQVWEAWVKSLRAGAKINITGQEPAAR